MSVGLGPSELRSLQRLTARGVPVVVGRMGLTGLGLVRSLARQRVPVVAVDVRPRSTSAHTRLCSTLLADDEAGFWPLLLEVGSTLAGARPALVLTTDHDVLEASNRRQEVADLFRFRLPEPAALNLLMDKVAFAGFARSHGLPVPATYVVQSDSDWDPVLREGRFPLVVKPNHRTPGWLAAGLPKVVTAESPDRLEALLPELREVECDYVAQEWVPGPDSAIYFHLAYYDAEHRPLAGFTGRKVRQWPVDVGSTSAAVAAVNEEVDERATRVLTLAGLTGFGSVEFKWDARDGAMKIMEPTVGRPNLQEETSTANGLNIAYRGYCDLIGVEPAPVVGRRKARGWFLLEADLQSFLARRRTGELSLREFLATYRGGRYYADFSWRDPAPFALTVLEAVRLLSASAVRSLRRAGRRRRQRPGTRLP